MEKLLLRLIGISSRHQSKARIAAVFGGNTTTATIDSLPLPRRRTATYTSSSTHTTTTTTKEQSTRLFSSIPYDTSTATATTTMHNITNINRTIVTHHQRIVPSSFYSPYQYNYNKHPYCYQQRNNNHYPFACYYSTSFSTLKQGSSTKVGNDHNSSNDDTAKDQSQQSQLSSSQSPLSSPLSSPLVDGTTRRKKKKLIPRKAAVELTEKSRTLFQKLLEHHPTKDGILLNYNQSSTGEPRMVFSFSFVSKDGIADEDEGVSLEVDEDGNPKSPRDALDDGLPKLWVHHNAFIKVLGCTVDVDTENITPILYDKEGFEKDANL